MRQRSPVINIAVQRQMNSIPIVLLRGPLREYVPTRILCSFVSNNGYSTGVLCRKPPVWDTLVDFALYHLCIHLCVNRGVKWYEERKWPIYLTTSWRSLVRYGFGNHFSNGESLSLLLDSWLSYSCITFHCIPNAHSQHGTVRYFFFLKLNCL